MDWGVTLNGVLSALDYEFAVTRGSGNKYVDRDDPYLFYGRLGTPSHKNLIFGLSYLYGKVLGKEGATYRKRIGIDVAHYINQYELLFEASGGEDEDAEVYNSLAEISWRSRSETVHFYSQVVLDGRKVASNWQDELVMRSGVNWSFCSQSDLSVAWYKTLDTFADETKSSDLIMQLRVRI